MVTMLLVVCALPMALGFTAVWVGLHLEHERSLDNWYLSQRIDSELRRAEWAREDRLHAEHNTAPKRRFRPAPWGGCVYDVLGGGVA